MQGSRSKRQGGQSLVEIALVLALVLLVLIGVLQILGVSLAEALCGVASAIGVEPDRCVSGLVFRDDFSQDSGQWRFLRGSDWRRQNGQLCAGPSEHRALAIGSEADDSTVSVDANLDQGQGYGVYFRSHLDESGQLHGYVFQYDPGYGQGEFLFRKWINGYETSPFARSAPPAGYQWWKVTRHIEIVATGNQMTAKVDGVVVLTAVDNSYRTGAAGLRTWSSSRVCFDDFTVTAP